MIYNSETRKMNVKETAYVISEIIKSLFEQLYRLKFRNNNSTPSCIKSPPLEYNT